jgi:hypothetical protein
MRAYVKTSVGKVRLNRLIMGWSVDGGMEVKRSATWAYHHFL